MSSSVPSLWVRLWDTTVTFGYLILNTHRKHRFKNIISFLVRNFRGFHYSFIYWYYITFEHPELSCCGHIWKCRNCFMMANTWWALLILDVMSSSVPPDVVMLQRYIWRCRSSSCNGQSSIYSDFFLTLKIFFLICFLFLSTLKLKSKYWKYC